MFEKNCQTKMSKHLKIDFDSTEIRRLLRSNIVDTSNFDESEKETLNSLFVDTVDVLACDELTGQAMLSSVGVLLNALVDKIAEKLPSKVDSKAEFVHPGKSLF
jgi:hypothetical protein